MDLQMTNKRKSINHTLLEKGCYTPEWGTVLAIIHILSACEV